MDLSVIYSKTPKGLRARSSWIGGLSSRLMKVLLLVDGSSKVETILNQSDIAEQELVQALTKLEAEGYIRLVPTRSQDSWNRNPVHHQKKVEETQAAHGIEVEEIDSESLDFSHFKAETNTEAETQKNKEVAIRATEKARLEAERKAREEAERQAREEEVRLKAEAEARARAEEAARQEAERKAQEEAERKAREEAERQAREEEARLKAEAEARARAEEAARQEAERKAQEEAERKAREEAERQAREEEARLRAEAEARASSEEAARQEAERKAQEEAERKAREEAERQAREEAERQAREEAERQAREEEARLKAEAEARARAEEAVRQEAERKAQEEAKTRAAAEEAARLEADRLAKEEKAALDAEAKARKEAEKQAKEEARRIAREEAEVKARLKAEERAQARLTMVVPSIRRQVLKVSLGMLVFIPFALILLVAALHFVNLSLLVKPVERLASDTLGAPVAVKEVRASLWPEPHLVMGNVIIGDMQVESVDVVPAVSTLFKDVTTIKSLRIEGLKVGQESFDQVLQWIGNSGKAARLKIEQTNVAKLMLRMRELELGPFSGKLTLTDSHVLSGLDLKSDDHKLAIRLSPRAGSFAVDLTANNWSLPANPKILFDGIEAKGEARQSKISFTKIEGKAYGGRLTARASVDWSAQWSVSGDFKLSGASTQLMLQGLPDDHAINGAIDLAGNFVCKSNEVSRLTETPELAATFNVRDGKIGGIDLVRGVLAGSNQSQTGGGTNFDKLSGIVQAKGGLSQYRQLVLESAKFRAKGNVDVLPNSNVSGQINAELSTPSRRIQSSISLAGQVGNLKQQ